MHVYIIVTEHGLLWVTSPLSSGTLNGDWGVARTNWEGVCLDLGVLVIYFPLSSGILNGDWSVARTNWGSVFGFGGIGDLLSSFIALNLVLFSYSLTFLTVKN